MCPEKPSGSRLFFGGKICEKKRLRSTALKYFSYFVFDKCSISDDTHNDYTILMYLRFYELVAVYCVI